MDEPRGTISQSEGKLASTSYALREKPLFTNDAREVRNGWTSEPVKRSINLTNVPDFAQVWLMACLVLCVISQIGGWFTATSLA
jgi:hypothetical protein